jgi:hypothetical protein
MKKREGTQNDKLSIAVIINQLSCEQLSILDKLFKQMSKPPNILLVRQIPCILIPFYQLRNILLLEEALRREVKEALCLAGTGFNVPVMRRVIQGSTWMHVFQALPEIDHLIGDSLDKPRFFIGSQHPAFMGGIQSWAEST